MGKLTLSSIITQGIQLAGKASGNPALITFVQTEMNAWLRSTYKGWLWPWLNVQATAVSLTAGSTSLLIGGGSGGITSDIADVFDPIWIYSTAFTLAQKARVRQIRGGRPENEPAINDPALNKGIPIEFKARPSPTVEGQWTLTPFPVPDRALLLAIDYKLQPADITTSDTPRYENDRTLIRAAKVFTLEYMKDETFTPELEMLAAMVLQDYQKEAAKTGSNDNIGLDPNFFPPVR